MMLAAVETVTQPTGMGVPTPTSNVAAKATAPVNRFHAGPIKLTAQPQYPRFRRRRVEGYDYLRWLAVSAADSIDGGIDDAMRQLMLVDQPPDVEYRLTCVGLALYPSHAILERVHVAA